MNLQNLLEHSEKIIQLLKQIKIANRTGVDTVPAYLQHVSINSSRNFVLLNISTLDKKTKKFWYPIAIRHYDNLSTNLTVRVGIWGNIHQHNLTEITKIIKEFLQLSTDIQLGEPKIKVSGLNNFEFVAHLPKLKPWLKWINDDTTRPILIKAAWQQGQKDNYQFQRDSQ